jgi:hypothetical protein
VVTLLVLNIYNARIVGLHLLGQKWVILTNCFVWEKCVRYQYSLTFIMLTAKCVSNDAHDHLGDLVCDDTSPTFLLDIVSSHTYFVFKIVYFYLGCSIEVT